jgi:hypothetical protein
VIWGQENALTVFVTRDYTGISRKFESDPLRYYTRHRGTEEIPMGWAVLDW